MKTAIVSFEVEYDEDRTDSDAVTCALQVVLETALSTPDLLGEYGDVLVGDFTVRDEDPDAPFGLLPQTGDSV
jgi:hypothetical protein